MGRVLEILKGEKLREIREEIEKFCSDILGEYLEECGIYCKKTVLSPFNVKNFYDSVWGTIEINQGEILILDSPILQRLRHIKQLGLADLLYSSADHSRFSHTLGVIQTATVMQKQIEKELLKKGISTHENINQIVRLAAIFHDSGHMFCSHASERFFQKKSTYSQYEKVDTARGYFDTVLGGVKPSLSELISMCIVQSPSVRKLISIVESGLIKLDFNNGKEDEIIEKICCFIIGYPYSEKMLPYAQIISGQIDSDKLDYLKRDSHSTGVPVAVDMSRVFQKLRVVEAKKDFSMKSTSDEDVDIRYTLAIAPAAINTIDQLIVSRYMMFENVYFHQKTLTAEELLRYALDKLDCSTKGVLDNFYHIMFLEDSDVICNDFSSTIKKWIADCQIVDEQEYKEACDILSNLYKRKLFKRSVAFTNENLVDVGHTGYSFYSKLFTKKVEAEQQKFIGLVRQTILEFKEKLKDADIRFNKKTDILLIIAPDIVNVSLNSNLAIAEKNNKYRDMEFEADNWLKSRTSRKPQNYLVTYAEDRFLVYIVVEYVLLKHYGLLISDSVIYDEKEGKQIERLKKIMWEKGVYNDFYALAPNDEIEMVNRKLENMVKENWKYYELISVDNGFAKAMDRSHVTMFVKQFYQFENELGDYNIFVQACTDMLNSVRIISKNEIFRALSGNFSEILKKEKCGYDRLKVCNIGDVQDGSAQISYQINSINEAFKMKLRVQPLREALKFSEENQIIVFIEDAFCSGKQLLSIFETYMGIPIEERQTKEIHVQELSEEEKRKLAKSKIYFSFIFYNEDNKEFFLKRLSEIGLDKVHLVAREKFPEGYFRTSGSGTEEKRKTVLKKYLEAAGKMLIEQKATDSKGIRKESWSDERMANSILGYNDAQQLIVFAWNTPTYTITPLWLEGGEGDMKWYPLFPRIDK